MSKTKKEKKMRRQFKSTRKVTLGQKTYRKWEEWDTGDVLIAKFMDQEIDNYDKPNYLMEVIDAQFKDSKLGAKLEGKTLALNHCGILGKAMEKISKGEMVQLTYNGTSKIEKGKFAGKDAHLMDIEVVEEDTGEEVEL
jgi:hypothetical protein